MNLFRNTLTAGLFILILAGCKASTSPTGQTTTDQSMAATVDGQAWSSVVVPLITGGATAYFNKMGPVTTAGAITVVGLSASNDGSAISIALLHPHVGTDSLGDPPPGSGNVAFISFGTNQSDQYVSGPLEGNFVTVTKFDTVNRQISGSFQFIGHQTDTVTKIHRVTNGSFLNVEWSK